MPTELLTRVNWDLQYPRFTELCFELAARCSARGCNYFATSGFRTPAEQHALWQKGRNAAGVVIAPKAVVTRVRFGAHNAGVAADFCRDVSPDRGLQPSWEPEDYDVLAEEAEGLGLEAGHRWKSFRDSPHVQLPLGRRDVFFRHLQAAHAKGGSPAVFAILDTAGPWGPELP